MLSESFPPYHCCTPKGCNLAGGKREARNPRNQEPMFPAPRLGCEDLRLLSSGGGSLRSLTTGYIPGTPPGCKKSELSELHSQLELENARQIGLRGGFSEIGVGDVRIDSAQ